MGIMTPEERAAKIVKDDNWYFDDYYFDGEDERQTSTIDRDILRDEIAATIGAAIAEEREACARICDTRGQDVIGEWYGNEDFRRGANTCAHYIRARGVAATAQEISPKKPVQGA